MKSILAIIMTVVFLFADPLPLTNTKTVTSGKISTELQAVLSEMDDDDVLAVHILINDVNHDDIMKSFSEKYYDEYREYICAKESDLSADLERLNGGAIPSNKYHYDEIDVINDVLLQRAIEIKRSLFREAYSQYNCEFADSISGKDDQIFISEYSPMVVIQTTCNAIKALGTDTRVVWIDIFHNYEVTDLLSTANTISKADVVRDNYGNKGNGVLIGQLEKGLPDDQNPQLQNVIVDTYSGGTVENHATSVALIMVGSADGIAPLATLYSTCAENGTQFFYRIEWLLSKGVNIINLSCTLVSEGSYDMYSAWMDHIAINHDVHIVAAAGNYDPDNNPYLMVSNIGMAYNVITVGGYNDKNTTITTDDEMANFSAYYELTTQNRPEKPNLIASAAFINTGITNLSGTSYAAPQVAGVIAQLCSYKAELKTKQSTMGAMLTAGSNSKIAGFSNYLITGSSQINDMQGAGKLNARSTRSISADGNCWRVKIPASSFPYTKSVEITANSSRKVRIAIFWLKQNSITGSHIAGTLNLQPLSNLDLKVYAPDGSLLRQSTTVYSNYEIIQFTPEQTGTYTIKIINNTTGSTLEEIVGIAVCNFAV